MTDEKSSLMVHLQSEGLVLRSASSNSFSNRGTTCGSLIGQRISQGKPKALVHFKPADRLPFGRPFYFPTPSHPFLVLIAPSIKRQARRSYLICCLDVHSVISFGQANHSFRELCSRELRFRINHALSTHFGGAVTSFIDLLRSTKSIIGGPLVSSLLATNPRVIAANFDLYCQPSKLPIWLEFLRLRSLIPYPNTGMVIKAGAFSQPFHIPCTSYANFITADNIIIAYPIPSISRTCISSAEFPEWNDVYLHHQAGLQLHQGPSSWTTACGLYCPHRVRLLGDAFCRVVYWNLPNQGQDLPNLNWMLDSSGGGNCCENRLCSS